VNPQIESYSLMEGVNEKVATSSHLFSTGKKLLYMEMVFYSIIIFLIKTLLIF